MLRLTDVVKHILIINIILFIGTSFLGDNRIMLAMFYPESPFFRPWQIATHMFMHADLMHLFFNLFALWMFGSAVEMVWGSKKILKERWLMEGERSFFGSVANSCLSGFWNSKRPI